MEKYKSDVNNLNQLIKKYDAKTNLGVRGVRKKLMLSQNPSIIKEKGEDWENYLYNTPMDGELDEYKKQIEKKLTQAQISPVLDVPQKLDNEIPQNGIFNSHTGEFENENRTISSRFVNKSIFDASQGEFKGFMSNEEKQITIDIYQKEIEEINILLKEKTPQLPPTE